MEFKRREEKDIEVRMDRRNWRIYGMPVDLINWYISYAKLYCDNEVWKVVELGKKAIEKEKEEWKIEIEKRLNQIENILEKMTKKKEEVSVVGGKRKE